MKQRAKLSEKFERCRQTAARVSALQQENQRLLIEVFQDPRPPLEASSTTGSVTEALEPVVVLSNVPWLTQHRPADENAQKVCQDGLCPKQT